MSSIVWNIRGIHKQDFLDHLKVILRQHKARLLVLLEPKVSHAELPEYAFDLGFQFYLHVGDFNEITSISEKIGRRLVDDPGMHDFQRFILTNALIDAGFEANQFTWSNNRCGAS